MSDGELPELLRRRLDLVTRLAMATSQLQKCWQTRMAADMDAQRCDLARDDHGGDEAARELQREWDEALRRSDEAESGAARCEALIEELERSLAEADRELAESSSRREGTLSRQTPGAFPLFDLLARVWRLPAPAVCVRFDRASLALAAALADGRIALIDAADAEPPDNRIEVDEAGRRAIAPRRESPRPAVVMPARGQGPALIAAGPEGFVAARADGTLSRLARDGSEKLLKACGPLRALDVCGNWGLALVGENGVELRDRDGSAVTGGGDWGARAVAISPRGGRVVFGGGRTLRIVERADPFGAARTYECPGEVERIVWRADESYLVALCGAGGLALVDLERDRFGALGDFPTPPRAAEFSADGEALVAAGAYRIAAWDLNRAPFAGERGGALETGRPGLVPVVRVAALPRRKLVAAAYGNGQIVIAALGQRDELILQALGPEPDALIAAPDGRALAVASGDSLALVALPDALFK